MQGHVPLRPLPERDVRPRHADHHRRPDVRRNPRQYAKGVDPKAAGLGDCIDCGQCVNVCPTGIDIRDGLQYECIGCAACIDVCDQVMDKVSLPRGLIRDRPRTRWPSILGKKEILGLTSSARASCCTPPILVLRSPGWPHGSSRTAFRSEGGRYWRPLDAGRARPTTAVSKTSLHCCRMNTEERPHRYKVTVDGLAGAEIAGADEVEVPPATLQSFNTVVLGSLRGWQAAPTRFTWKSLPRKMPPSRSARKLLSSCPKLFRANCLGGDSVPALFCSPAGQERIA